MDNLIFWGIVILVIINSLQFFMVQELLTSREPKKSSTNTSIKDEIDTLADQVRLKQLKQMKDQFDLAEFGEKLNKFSKISDDEEVEEVKQKSPIGFNK